MKTAHTSETKAKGDQAVTDERAKVLLAQVDRARLPGHIAIIMDGNGRWARQHGYSDRTRGHLAAVDAVRATVRVAVELGIRVLTLFAFSTENWRRPRTEVTFLMRHLERFLRQERAEMMRGNIRLVHSGSFERLPLYAQLAVRKAIAYTARNTGMTLNMAISYGAREEIVAAARRFAADAAAGRRKIADLDEDLFGQYLYHPELGDPDLLIRTSGEMRISNFLLWQLAYAEIYVTPTLWPDFNQVTLLEAILDYQRRERRFGGIG